MPSQAPFPPVSFPPRSALVLRPWGVPSRPLDPVPTDLVSPAESSRATRRGASNRVAEPQHYLSRPPQHPQLSLQRRAPSTLRRHLARAAGRFAVLLTADLAAFAIQREL